jgi:glucose-1-phosphate cytidylyltransferase
MKVVIFSGGIGTRIDDEGEALPKAMIDIGGKPVIWHVMKMYSAHGFNDFVVCLGYKGHLIKEYFLHFFMYHSDIRIHMSDNTVEILDTSSENFRVTLVDTGLHTKTAGRLARVKDYLNGEDFMVTYSNNLSDVNLSEVMKFHHSHRRIATVTSVQLESRFGGLEIGKGGEVVTVMDNSKEHCQWVSGGFFVLRPSVFDYLHGDQSDISWEHQPLQKLAADRQLMAFQHAGYWKNLDVQRDKVELENIWNSKSAKWKSW